MAEMKECIIGIDAGTASVKGLLVDVSGTIVATASGQIRLSTPPPGRPSSARKRGGGRND